MDDTEEAGSFPATTPQDEQRCTRLTSCKKAECLTCNKSGTGTHHVRDLSQELDGTVTHNDRELSQELETTPPKKISKPLAPPDHVISSITTDFQQAFLDDDLEEIKILLTFFDLHVKTSLDIFKYDRSKLTKTLKTARELIEPKSQPPPVPAPMPTSPPQPQTVSMKLPRAELTKWTGLSYDFYPWIEYQASNLCRLYSGDF